MTATKPPAALAPYTSGLCTTGLHDRCKGAWGTAVCDCRCHQEAEEEPEGPRILSLFSGYGGLDLAVSPAA